MLTNQRYREFTLRWSPPGSASTITLTPDEQNYIGAFSNIQFRQVTMPATFYVVSTINNTASLSEGASNPDLLLNLSYIFHITPANYTAATFAAAVATALQSVSPNSLTYTVTISPTTGTLTISTSMQFQISFTPGNPQMEKIWGVRAGTASPQINATSGSYTSINPVQLWGPDQLLIVSPTITSYMQSRNLDISPYEIPNTLLRVSVQGTPFTQITFNSQQIFAAISLPIPSNIIIDVLDESGNSINLNGGYVYLTIAIS